MRRLLVLLLTLLLGPACGRREEAPRARGRAEVAVAGLAEQAAEAERIGFPLLLEGPHGLRFVLVPRGSFRMGSPLEEQGRAPDEAPHDVRIVTPYYLQLTEVTNAQFRAFRPQHHSGAAPDGTPLDGDEQPAVRLNHHEAEEYAAWLTAQDPPRVYRLPTEAEWEHAARAGSGTAWATGDVLAEDVAVCWQGQGPQGARPVASRPPNAWNLFDMCGNAAEWCQDWYAPYPLWVSDDPQGPMRGDERVVRGGSWAAGPNRLRSAHRGHLPPASRCGEVGFRLVVEVGYGDAEHGRHGITFRTVDPSAGPGSAAELEGYELRMISIVKRLTDRQRELSPRWRNLEGRTPVAMQMAPGRYYVYAYRRDGNDETRGEEVKFAVPDDGPVIDVPIPISEQRGPHRR